MRELNQCEIKKSLRGIVDILDKEVLSVEGVGLLKGKGGISLLFCLYGKYMDDPYFVDRGMGILTKNIFDFIAKETKISYSLHEGLAGIGWLYEHLSREIFIEDDSNEVLQELDDYLVKVCKLINLSGNWDLLYGSLGIALYFLKRVDKKPLYANLLVEYVRDLSSWAKKEGDGIKWYSATRDYNNIEPNISFAHGASSIIAFLSKLKNKGIQDSIIDDLLISSVNFVLSNEFIPGTYKSHFPAYSLETKYKIYHSRLGWCYGDLSIAIALWQAATALQDISLKNKSISIVESTFNRKTFMETFVADACLCHGSSGIALMYIRMFFETRKTVLLENAYYWIRESLEYMKNSEIDGFKFWSGREEKFVINYNLLDGLTGVGLLFLSYLILDSKTQSWDECLLLS